MKLNIEEFKDYIFDIAGDLIDDENYRPFLRKAFKDLEETKREEVINACQRIVSVLDRKSPIIENHHKNVLRKRKLREKNEDEYLNRTDARKYTSLPESTFDKKVKEHNIKDMSTGSPRYKISDLDKIARLIIDSSERVLCINTQYYFERSINAYIKFDGGQYYPIVDENENSYWLYNEKHNISIHMPKRFAVNFRKKEDLSF